jgi:predicted lipoprotein with Yx(FWY)xxD motif
MRYKACQMIATGSLLVLGLAACSNDSPSISPLAGGTSGATSSAASDTASPAATNATLVLSDSALGAILTDNEGNTVYQFAADKNGKSACYEGCDSTWPPLEAKGTPTAGQGVDDSLLGTAERTDGITQVTYAGHPLYRYSGDRAPGDTNGQGIGDVWYVVAASGDPVGGQGGASGSSSSGGMYG